MRVPSLPVTHGGARRRVPGRQITVVSQPPPLSLPQFTRHDIGPALSLNHLHANWNAMSCGLGQHFIISPPPPFPLLPLYCVFLWFILCGGKGRVSVKMNMNAVIMCD